MYALVVGTVLGVLTLVRASGIAQAGETTLPVCVCIEGRAMVAFGVPRGFWRFQYNEHVFTAWLERGHDVLSPGVEVVWDDTTACVIVTVPAEPCTLFDFRDPPRPVTEEGGETSDEEEEDHEEDEAGLDASPRA